MATQPMSRRHVGAGARQPRDPKLESTDVAALRAIAQAAVEVELFTIPLYMTTLYSIQGMHQITGKNNAFYQNRLWPGPTATARPETPNETAFNIIFSVFIQEMLHLQLAANMATAIGHTPDFTASALQAKDTHAWTCYGPDKTIIPYIVDLRDTRDYKDVKVNLGPVSAEQLKLFLAIEQPEELAQANIEGVETKYPIKVPFENWEPGKPLPMFGTIGRMYQCYHDYLHLKYTNGSTLWGKVYNPGGQQNDLFNNFGGPGHPMREFMGFKSTIALTYPDIAFRQMLNMMDAITDQGEGSVLKSVPELLTAVEKRYQPSLPALESDYPDFDDIGKLIESADAPARYDNDSKDHYERFQQVAEAVDRIQTWGPWLKQHGPWTAAGLVVAGKEPPINPKLPSAADVAAALNTLAAPDAGQDYYKLLSQAAIGAIAGVTTVLDKFWNAEDQQKSPVGFPFPSMAGAGDRLAICWAVFGKAPDLSIGLEPPVANTLYHSCQAIDYTSPQPGTNACAQVTVFHACRGSNDCRARGGCGFVQLTTGGGSCSTMLAASTAIGTRTFGAGCNPFAGDAFSAPGDNKCATFGGCAVPISASQLFPKSGHMQLFKFDNSGGEWKAEPTGRPLLFAVGDNVHDVAWKAYKEVMGLDNSLAAPAPTTLRLAFPPST